MKKIIKRIVCLGLTLIACVGMLCACNERDVGKEYGATIISNVDKHMREDFLEENKIGLYYYATYYDEETGMWKQKPLYDIDGPKTREFIITNEEEYLSIFKDTTSIAVDFETQMIVVHMFAKTNARPLLLVEMRIEGNELFVRFKDRSIKPGYKDTSAPGRVSFAIVMDKYDITSAQFVYE